MKRVIFLAVFGIFFINSVFAKTPEIINPPRPHAKFKLLLVVEHTLYPGYTHYLYVDKYHVFREPDNWVWILPVGRYEAYSAIKGETPRPDDSILGIFYSVLLSYPEILKHTVLLRSKAPKPLFYKNRVSFNDPKRFMNFWTARAKKIKINPPKVKVVFKK